MFPVGGGRVPEWTCGVNCAGAGGFVDGSPAGDCGGLGGSGGVVIDNVI